MAVLWSGVTLLLMGLIFVAILTAAYNRLKIQQDPIVEAVLNILPGVNCGGCGLAGCGAYAEAVVKDHGLMGRCGPGGEDLVHQLAGVLGIEAATSAPVRSVVHCSAKTSDMINNTAYRGIKSCGEANMVTGAIGCSYGCLGYGDCVEACEFDAIHVIDGLATVDYEKCVGCGACVKACPRNLTVLHPLIEDPMMVIACTSLDKAKDVRSYCKVGCIGCGLCVKMAPGVFKLEQNLAIIDYDNYGTQEERDKGQGKCPRSLIVHVGTKVKSKEQEAENTAVIEQA